MKPRIQLAAAQAPDGGEMLLCQHDRDFYIKVNGYDLMSSRRHESELELARLGCVNLLKYKDACILIGGLGMGYTLRQALDLLDINSKVVVGELLPEVVRWNRELIGQLNGHPIDDERVDVITGDIVKIISRSKNKYNAILLDVDNGPDAISDSGNNRLYGYEGILACRRALCKNGCLAVWSAKPSKDFEQILMSCNFHVRRYRVPAHKGKRSQSHFVWVASEKKSNLPPGGGEPR